MISIKLYIDTASPLLHHHICSLQNSTGNRLCITLLIQIDNAKLKIRRKLLNICNHNKNI